jgi:outer membrane protein OmpA-like peptidoglycan-associated protein
MNRTAKAFTSSLFGAGLALALLTPPAAAQDAAHWLNDASDCEVYRALNDVVPAACAQPGDTKVDPVRTRGWGKTRGIAPRGISLLEEPAAGVTPAPADATPPADQPALAAAPEDEPVVAAVQQANPPATKSISARVQFEFDSFRLTDDAKAVLDRLAGVLKSDFMRDKTVRVEGYADATGPADYNLTLSQHRAEAVRAYLIQEHGIPAAQLPVVGKGATEFYDPAHPTAAVNRRVAFTNLTG